jgi:hypothetical protein
MTGTNLHSPFPHQSSQAANSNLAGSTTISANQRLVGAAHKLLHEQMLVKKNQALHPDQTINRARYGICIKKTDYRATQEDRVSV